jgi:hypothetical protein
LRAKFHALEPEIELEVKKGIEYRSCTVCGYKAAQVEELEEPLCKSDCHVCDTRDSFLRVPCSSCDENIEIGHEGPGEGTCPNEACAHEIDLDYLLEMYGPYQDPKEESEATYCGSCEHYEQSVIPLGDGYLCLGCGELHGRVGQCHWCGDHIAGFDLEGSAAFGCFMCAQAIPWDRR